MADFESHLFLELFLQGGRRQPKFKNRSLKVLFIVFIFDKESAINQATHLTIYLSNWAKGIEFGRIINLSREKSTERRQPRNVVCIYLFLCLLPLIPILKLLDPLPNQRVFLQFKTLAMLTYLAFLWFKKFFVLVWHISIQNIKLTQNYFRLSSILCQNYE